MIHKGEEILFTYGKEYWDRWRGDNDSESMQAQRRGGKRPAGGGDDMEGAEQRAKRTGDRAEHADAEGAGGGGKCGG